MLRAGKDRYKIEGFGQAMVVIDSPEHGNSVITLNEVAYVPGFLTNIVSLNRLALGNMHWSSEDPTQLRYNSSTFARLEWVEEHWVLEKDLQFIFIGLDLIYDSDGTVEYQSHAIRKVRNDRGTKKSDRPIQNTRTVEMAHGIMAHASPEVIEHLEQAVEGVCIDTSIAAPNSMDCVTCAVSKPTRLMS